MSGLISNSGKFFNVHGEVRHAHQGILERLEVRRWPSAKAPEQPGSFDLSDHRLRFRARDGAASQRHIGGGSRAGRSASVHRACISIMERKVPIGKVSPGWWIGDRHSATVRVMVALVRSALVVEREAVADQDADNFAGREERSAPHRISVIP